MTIDLQFAAKTAYQYARDQRAEGAIPIYLGLPGMLALMHRDIKEYSIEPDVDKLLSLVANAVCALAVAMDNEEYDEDDLDEIDGYNPANESFDEEAAAAENDHEIGEDTRDPLTEDLGLDKHVVDGSVDQNEQKMPESTMIEDAGRWSEVED